jgi:uncharacterized protein YukE
MFKWIECSDRVSYDVEKIEAMRKKISETSDELITASTTIQNVVTEMDTQWNTTEGRKFLSDIDMDWTKQVDSYVDVLKTIDTMLAYTNSIYTELTDKASKISFEC